MAFYRQYFSFQPSTYQVQDDFLFQNAVKPQKCKINGKMSSLWGNCVILIQYVVYGKNRNLINFKEAYELKISKKNTSRNLIMQFHVFIYFFHALEATICSFQNSNLFKTFLCANGVKFLCNCIEIDFTFYKQFLQCSHENCARGAKRIRRITQKKSICSYFTFIWIWNEICWNSYIQTFACNHSKLVNNFLHL